MQSGTSQSFFIHQGLMGTDMWWEEGEAQRERENHTYPVDKVLFSKVPINPVQYVECSVCTAIKGIILVFNQQ